MSPSGQSYVIRSAARDLLRFNCLKTGGIAALTRPDEVIQVCTSLGTKPKKTTANRKAAPRELMSLPDDKREVRRNRERQFQQSDDGRRSVIQDRKLKAKTAVKSGQGRRGRSARQEGSPWLQARD
jgi:hypothetical protein